MDANNSLSKNVSRFDFLYNRISMPRVCLAAWIRVPKFAEEIISVESKGIMITNEIFFDIASPILDEMLQNKKDNQEFRLPTLKRGLKYLRDNKAEGI